VPARAIKALSAPICPAEPATTTTASARSSVCGNAGCSRPRCQSPTTLTGRSVRAGACLGPARPTERCREPAALPPAHRGTSRSRGPRAWPVSDAIGQRFAELALQREHRGSAAQPQDVHRVVLFDDGGDWTRGATSRTVSVMFVLVVSSQLATTRRASDASRRS
jgi:hypothetical protein